MESTINLIILTWVKVNSDLWFTGLIKAICTWHLAVENILITMGRHGKKKAKMMMMMMMMMMPQCQQDDSSDSDEKTPHAPGQGSAGSEPRNQQRRSPMRPGAYIKNELAEIHKSATCVRKKESCRIWSICSLQVTYCALVCWGVDRFRSVLLFVDLPPGTWQWVRALSTSCCRIPCACDSICVLRRRSLEPRRLKMGFEMLWGTLSQSYLVGGLEHLDYFSLFFHISIYLGSSFHPNWLSYFSEG